MFKKIFAIMLMSYNCCVFAMDANKEHKRKAIEIELDDVNEGNLRPQEKKARIIPDNIQIDFEAPEANMMNQGRAVKSLVNLAARKVAIQAAQIYDQEGYAKFEKYLEKPLYELKTIVFDLLVNELGRSDIFRNKTNEFDKRREFINLFDEEFRDENDLVIDVIDEQLEVCLSNEILNCYGKIGIENEQETVLQEAHLAEERSEQLAVLAHNASMPVSDDQTIFLKNLEEMQRACDSKINEFKNRNLSFDHLIRQISAEINKADEHADFNSSHKAIDSLMDFLTSKLEIHQLELAVLLNNTQTRQYLDKHLTKGDNAIGISVLLLAVQYMRFEICRLLFNKGLKLSEEYLGERLIEAIRERESEMADFLLKIGASIKYISLHEAILSGNKKFVQILLDEGVDINQIKYNMTPLQFMISNSDHIIKSEADIKFFWEVLSLLISKGAKK